MNYQDYAAHRPGISAAAAECRTTPAAYCRWGESDRRAVIQNSGVDAAEYRVNQRDAQSIGDHQFEQSPQTFGRLLLLVHPKGQNESRADPSQACCRDTAGLSPTARIRSTLDPKRGWGENFSTTTVLTDARFN